MARAGYGDVVVIQLIRQSACNAWVEEPVANWGHNQRAIRAFALLAAD